MDVRLVLGAALAVSGCAFPGRVQRIGVEYNTAVAGMANELTLLNILRAKEDMPLHYTSVSRLSGSMVVRGTGGLNVQARGATSTVTDTTQSTTGTTVAAAPTGTTTTSALTGVATLASQVVEGVDVFTPSVGGEISSGPTFDIAIFDTQRFYQGILSAIPFSTVENYLNQGLPSDLVMALMVERVVFRRSDPGESKGEVVATWVNAPSGPEARAFADAVACYTLEGKAFQKPARDLAPMSRVAGSGTAASLTLQDLALVDGRTLELSEGLRTDPRTDAVVSLRRLSPERRVADLRIRSSCRYAAALGQPAGSGAIRDPRRPPDGPPPAPIYLGDFTAMELAPDGRSERQTRVAPEIVFRSTEGVIRYLGRYLRAAEESPDSTFRIGEEPLMTVSGGRSGGDLVSATLLGRRYAIRDDAARRRNMLVLAVVQQLVNLHKEATDRPTTVPVQVVP